MEREVLLDGGDDPTIRLRTDRWISTARIARNVWSARAEFGAQDAVADVAAGAWRGRWIPSDNHRIGIDLAGVAGPAHGRLVFLQEDGLFRGRLHGRLRMGPATLEGDLSRTRGQGRIELSRAAASPLSFSWSGSGWDAGSGVTLEFTGLGRARSQLLRSEEHPEPSSGRYRLETRSVGSGWRVEWEPVASGPWIRIDALHAELRTSGWSDTVGSDRKFHDLLVRASHRFASGGWIHGRWKFGVHGEEHAFDAPKASYFSPFLAWNVLDPAAWSPVDQILSDQREHVSGTADYRAYGGGASWFRPGRILDAGLSADLSWRALDVHALHRRTQMDLLGIGWNLETDSVGAPRLRIGLLSLGGEAALHLGPWGALVGRGEVGIPLWIAHLRRDGRAASADGGIAGGGSDDADGLWSLAAGWRGAW